MGRVEQIEREVQELTATELGAFRKWLLEFDAEAWDHQIEEDARAGKLDRLAAQALKVFESGSCSEL
ncbi:MAG: hypothetical protein ACLP5H_21280 [Desulfomonilaceae bacterium]